MSDKNSSKHKPSAGFRQYLFHPDDGRNIICAVIAAVLAVTLFFAVQQLRAVNTGGRNAVVAGFIYAGDETTPYSANFIRAARQLESVYGDRIKIIERRNVPYDSAAGVIEEMAKLGCDMIFTNSYGYGETAKQMAAKYPLIEFCAATCNNANSDPVLPNFHNFMGEIYQGCYISGIAAGAKLNQMISEGQITSDQAKLGFIGAYPEAEVISGYTAFLLGARSQCPTAVMRVKYINTWTSYSLEKKAAEQLIEEGCVIISHDTDTIGSAIACENADMPYTVCHVGYNQDMISVAPTSALISCRIEWSQYMVSAVEAIMAGDPIENHISGRVNGNDASGGLAEGWIKMLELNSAVSDAEMSEIVRKAEMDMADGKIHVFSGNYTGKDPDDPTDVCDLTKEYIENEHSSAPTFHYVLDGIITIDP